MPDALFDPGPSLALQRLLGEGALPLLALLSALGEVWGLLAVVGAVLWLRGLVEAWAVLLVALSATTVNTTLMLTLDVARPSHPELVVREDLDLPSFPSGHVATASAVYAWLALRRWLPWPSALLAVLALALARMALGMHFWGDVAAGALLGAAVAWAFSKVWPRLAALSGRPFAARTFALAPLAFVLVGAVAASLERSPKLWETAGAAAGAGLALSVEAAFVRYGPLPGSRPARLLPIGLAGAALLWALAHFLWPSSAPMHAVLGAASALWALLVYPTLIARRAG